MGCNGSHVCCKSACFFFLGGAGLAQAVHWSTNSYKIYPRHWTNMNRSCLSHGIILFALWCRLSAVRRIEGNTNQTSLNKSCRQTGHDGTINMGGLAARSLSATVPACTITSTTCMSTIFYNQYGSNVDPTWIKSATEFEVAARRPEPRRSSPIPAKQQPTRTCCTHQHGRNSKGLNQILNIFYIMISNDVQWTV